MRLVRYLQNLHLETNGSVVTIGNYDGVHLGHQAILSRLKQRAVQLNVPAVAVIFEPQPREYFSQHQNDSRLMTLREKLLALREFGVDQVLCLRFDAQLANLSAAEFLQNILVLRLKIRELFIGEDFVFGRQCQGNSEFLSGHAKKCNFVLNVIPDLRLHGVRISSTLIRQALECGDLRHAQEFLGRPYSILGRVIHGDKRARDLGFPTANIALGCKIIPRAGVYVVVVHGVADVPLYGVANVGFRPTIGDNKRLLEVFVFDFSQDIYGKMLRVEFSYFLREERKFANFAELQQQIILDIESAKAIYSNTKFKNDLRG